MTKEDELYNEENLHTLKSIQKRLEGSAIVPIPQMPEKMKAEIINKISAEIIGEVELDKKHFQELGEDINESIKLLVKNMVEAIEKNKPTQVTDINVKNIKDAHPEEIKVKGLTKELTALAQAIVKGFIENQPVLNIEKQEIRWPRSASEAIPVRLSDGKGFYKAVAGGITAAMGGGVEVDPLVGYQPSDIDDASSTKYYGFVKATGAWYIMRESSGSYRYSVGRPIPEQGGGLYSDAWTNRANLSYSYFYEVF